jgi:hypothetical protein
MAVAPPRCIGVMHRGPVLAAPGARILRHHNAAGRGASELVIVSGVPGRDGTPGTPDTITLAATQVTIEPPPGEHYYHARLTQEDGSMLWSAPIRVTQQR